MNVNEAVRRLTELRDQGRGEEALLWGDDGVNVTLDGSIVRRLADAEENGPADAPSVGPERPWGALWQLLHLTDDCGLEAAVALHNNGTVGVEFYHRDYRKSFSSVHREDLPGDHAAPDVVVLVNAGAAPNAVMRILRRVLRSLSETFHTRQETDTDPPTSADREPTRRADRRPS
jgi:hypothetical protein